MTSTLRTYSSLVEEYIHLFQGKTRGFQTAHSIKRKTSYCSFDFEPTGKSLTSHNAKSKNTSRWMATLLPDSLYALLKAMLKYKNK